MAVPMIGIKYTTHNPKNRLLAALDPALGALKILALAEANQNAEMSSVAAVP